MYCLNPFWILGQEVAFVTLEVLVLPGYNPSLKYYESEKNSLKTIPVSVLSFDAQAAVDSPRCGFVMREPRLITVELPDERKESITLDLRGSPLLILL